ncbi:MAG: efflux RND transporter permease subunit [Planctomycetota bacterium]
MSRRGFVLRGVPGDAYLVTPMRPAWPLACSLLVASACTTYEPAPLDVAALAARAAARRLDEVDLQRAVGRFTGEEPAAWPPARLDLPVAFAIALHCRPELRTARAELAASRAAHAAAGQWPNPAITLGPGLVTNPAGEIPWLLTAGVALPFDLGGKRRAAVEAAASAVAAAQIGIARADQAIRADVAEATDVVVTVFGEDLDDLDRAARRTAQVLATVPGVVDLRVGAEPGVPGFEVHLRRDRLTALGFTPREVLDDVEMALQGRAVGQVYQGVRTENVVVVLDPARRPAPERIGDLVLRSAGGTVARLADLAFVEPRSNRATILHEGGRRRQTITCNVHGADVGGVVQLAEQRVRAEVPLPAATYLSFEGAAAEATRARDELLLHSGLCALVALAILAFAAGNLRNLLILLVNLPFSLVGGVAVLWVTGTPQSMGATVGFVTLFGITARNSIMLISHFRHLVAVEGSPWNDATCARGAAERARPILMTALVTALGLLPIALGRAEAGREIEGPMALVILGGLVSSTALNFVLMPALCRRFGRFGAAPVRRPAAAPAESGGIE